jgi:hypothetical protein
MTWERSESFSRLNNRVGKMPAPLGVLPDYPAPIVRNVTDGREIAMSRWGMPFSTIMQTAKWRHQT